MNENVTADKNSAIVRGIKTIGIGKKGSRSMDDALVADIVAQIKDNYVPPASLGAFLGALMIKGMTDEEKGLAKAFPEGTLEDPQRIVEYIAPDASDFVKDVCRKLLQNNTLDKDTAKRLGDIIFSDQPINGARGLIASILRIRYETPDEYEGLLQSLQETLEDSFKQPPGKGEPIIQLAEPFDGVDRSYLITPLIANYLQNLNYRVVSLVGRNSGPKTEFNLLDLAEQLKAPIVKGNHEIQEEKPDYGWYISQQQMSKAMDRWVEIRHQTVKRPFMSTLERFMNPVGARIIVASAFHPPYGEKMLNICERAGYPGNIIIRNGIEGTLAFPLSRQVKILCSAKQKDQVYKRKEVEFNPEELFKGKIKIKERIEPLSLEENARMIEQYLKDGTTPMELFNIRSQVTCLGIKIATEWVNEHIKA